MAHACKCIYREREKREKEKIIMLQNDTRTETIQAALEDFIDTLRVHRLVAVLHVQADLHKSSASCSLQHAG